MNYLENCQVIIKEKGRLFIASSDEAPMLPEGGEIPIILRTLYRGDRKGKDMIREGTHFAIEFRKKEKKFVLYIPREAILIFSRRLVGELL